MEQHEGYTGDLGGTHHFHLSLLVPLLARPHPQSTSGSLSTARGWWGFAMAIGALLSTVVYYVLLQACRHLGFTAVTLQHSMNCASVLFYLPLTLPLDGTAWGTQFAGWGAADWAALLALSTVAYMGSGIFMQVGRLPASFLPSA